VIRTRARSSDSAGARTITSRCYGTTGSACRSTPGGWRRGSSSGRAAEAAGRCKGGVSWPHQPCLHGLFEVGVGPASRSPTICRASGDRSADRLRVAHGSDRIVKMGEDSEPLCAIGPRSITSGQHQPLNRQAERYAREGVDLSLSTLADQVGACAAVLAPIHALIRTYVLRDRWRTRFRCSRRVERGRPGSGPMSATIARSRTAHRRLCCSTSRATGRWPTLTGISRDGRGSSRPMPTVVTTTLYRGDRDPAPVSSALCWSHARRKFFELADIPSRRRR
jgi:hypothetical protein